MLECVLIKSGRPTVTKNLQGQKFGRWKINEFFDIDPNGGARWECTCECGTKRIVKAQSLKSGASQSCGCITLYLNSLTGGKNHNRWNGFEEISGTLFKNIRSGAKERNLDFTITIEELWEVFLKQNKKCAFTGIELKFNSNSRSSNGTASPDRIDNSKGYIPGNIQWVHKIINIMKLDMTDSEFIYWCNQVSYYKGEI